MKPEQYPKELYPFQGKWVKVLGNQIHYIDEGEGQVTLQLPILSKGYNS